MVSRETGASQRRRHSKINAEFTQPVDNFWYNHIGSMAVERQGSRVHRTLVSAGSWLDEVLDRREEQYL